MAQRSAPTPEASTSLLEFLRDTLEMKGSKLCCNTWRVRRLHGDLQRQADQHLRNHGRRRQRR
jgi:hypothetical protein